jgi:hypothetical protein
MIGRNVILIPVRFTGAHPKRQERQSIFARIVTATLLERYPNQTSIPCLLFGKGGHDLGPGSPNVMKTVSIHQLFSPGTAPLPIAISTEAYPDSPLRAAGNDHVPDFP